MRRKERKMLQEYIDMCIECRTEMISDNTYLLNGLQEIKEKIALLNDSAQAQIEATEEITEARKDLESRD